MPLTPSADFAAYRAHGAPVVTVAEMRALEAAAMAAGAPEEALQARAARQIADLAARLRPAGRVVVLAGPGNNGRDAVLAGIRLADAGREVAIFLGPRNAILEEELLHVAAVAFPARVCRDEADFESLRSHLDVATLAIDGLLGIGVHGPMRAPLDRFAGALNTARRDRGPDLLVLAVDVPSGVDADSGDVPGEAVRADVTLALGGIKIGTLRFPAASRVGTQRLAGIGLPTEQIAGARRRAILTASLPPLLPPRPLNSHKGSLGWALVVGGSSAYVGAPLLSATAAARAGCGLVALSTVAAVTAAAAVSLPEATYLPRADDEPPSQTIQSLLERLGSFRALLVGPGLGRGAQASALVTGLLASVRQAVRGPGVVVDADGLNALAERQEWWRAVPERCVLTPHAGEMARLTGQSTARVIEHDFELAVESAARWRQIVVLKGPHTIVAAPSEPAWVYPHPNPALATAGSGDVLAGIIAGLLAQAAEPAVAARLGVGVHALAARAATVSRATDRLLASDLWSEIPRVMTRFSQASTPGSEALE
ncbi:MAG: NAD(P)H-hydrate dehydratase [Chloroflexi bacterium]|nr:NAD(P)H-hydrate dehydratase [Chloroflexota bacterium]